MQNGSNVNCKSETINANELQEMLLQSVDGDIKDVFDVLQDIRKTVEFAMEFEGQQIYIGKDISRKLKYAKLILEFKGYEKDIGRKAAIRKISKVYGYTIYWVKKILNNHFVNEKQKVG